MSYYKLVILIEKRGTQLDKFFELFINHPEIAICEIKRAIATSSYRTIAVKKLDQIIKTVEQIEPEIYLFRFSHTNRQGRWVRSIQRNPKMEIKSLENFFALVIEKNEPKREKENLLS